jgi:predicted nucleic acid-binding protein
MKRVFADTCYWFALLSPHDGLHATAVAAQVHLAQAQVVTTDEVLGEFLNLTNARAPGLRAPAAELVLHIRADNRVLVKEQSRASFDSGHRLYHKRHDRQYSWVDCVSFACMLEMSIREALTDDHHFEQEQFTALLRLPPV